MVTSVNCVYKINEPAGENAAWLYDLREELKLSYQGLQLCLCAGPRVAPFVKEAHHFLYLIIWDRYQETIGIYHDSNEG